MARELFEKNHTLGCFVMWGAVAMAFGLLSWALYHAPVQTVVCIVALLAWVSLSAGSDE